MINLNDEQLRQEWDETDKENVTIALSYLERVEGNTVSILAEYVAAICNISVTDLTSKEKASHIVHARWLFWYAYRYMTHESYPKMSKTVTDGSSFFTASALQLGVCRMSTMVANEPTWGKRWKAIKHFIKLRSQGEEKLDNTITINVPKHLKDTITIKIQDK